MPVFFVPPSKVGPVITIEGQDAKHIYRSLRKGIGDEITVTDGIRFYRCTITQVSRGKVGCRVEDVIEKNTEPPIYVSLFQALPKGKKLNFVLQKCTEIGVSEFVIFSSERTVPVPKNPEVRVERWKKIAAEAAKQCGRLRAPEVRGIVSFEDAIAHAENFDLVIVPWELETNRTLREILKGVRADKIAFFIGPEGGFSTVEVEELRARGAVTATLGPRILRTETAGLVVASIVLYELGDISSLPEASP